MNLEDLFGPQDLPPEPISPVREPLGDEWNLYLQRPLPLESQR